MGAGVSGNQGKPSILAGAGRGRAFDAETDAAALRLLEEQKHLFADYTTVRQSLENGTSIQGRDRDILDALVELDARLDLVTYTQTAKRLTTGRDEQSESIGRLDAVRAARRSARSPFRSMARHGACRFAGSRCVRVRAVAGGLGERLGYDGIKVSLPTESTTGTCYLELYIKTILAFERRSGNTLPLCLMLSKDTEAATRALLKEHNNFGMRADQISFVVQAGVPLYRTKKLISSWTITKSCASPTATATSILYSRRVVYRRRGSTEV